MITCAQQVQPHPAVVDTTLDTGEVVLLHLDTKTYYSLNSTGALIWQGLKESLTLQAISQQLQNRYVVAAEQAESSVLNLVTELLSQQLIQDRGA